VTARSPAPFADERSARHRIAQHLGELLYNQIVTYLPAQSVRRWTLRLFGANLGRRFSIGRATNVFGPADVVAGDDCVIGDRCLLDARGGLTIGNGVVIAGDTQLITAYHDYRSPNFESYFRPTAIEDEVRIGARCTVESGVRIGRAATVLSGSLVHSSVETSQVVGGVPARQLAADT
jgi:putative colanic acid biosynthesis acetyltransferase WcaF